MSDSANDVFVLRGGEKNRMDHPRGGGVCLEIRDTKRKRDWRRKSEQASRTEQIPPKGKRSESLRVESDPTK